MHFDNKIINDGNGIGKLVLFVGFLLHLEHEDPLWQIIVELSLYCLSLYQLHLLNFLLMQISEQPITWQHLAMET